MEIDHIEQRADGGSNDIGNAVPLCFDCHAEVHAYNPKHPRGRKFTPSELRAHRDQWLKLCKEHPAIFAGQRRDAEVGPVQAMIDELEFNAALASKVGEAYDFLPALHVDQFKRAIAAGSISALRDELQTVVIDAYCAAERVDAAIRRVEGALAGSAGRSISGSAYRIEATKTYAEAATTARKAVEELLKFLGSEP